MYLLTTVVQPTMRITSAMLVTVNIYDVNTRTNTLMIRDIVTSHNSDRSKHCNGCHVEVFNKINKIINQ